MFLVILLYALFGFTFTLGKIALFYAPPFFFIACRMLIGGGGLLAFLYFNKHIRCSPQMKDWPYYAQVALFGIFFPYCLRAWGLQYISSTKAAFIFTLMPFFTALFSFLFHKEKLSYRKTIGLMLGFVGMMPTLFTTNSVEQLAGAIGFLSWPEIATIAAVACFGYNLIAMQNLVKHRGCPAVLANGISMMLGGFLAFNASLLVEPVWIYSNFLPFAGILALQILISNIVCSNLQATLLKHYSPTFLAFAGFLTPLCAAFYGWYLLGEAIYIHYLISFCMVLLGLTIFYYDEMKRHKKIPKEMVLDPKEF